MDMPMMQFADSEPMAVRIKLVAPVLNALIKGFYDGTMKVGVELMSYCSSPARRTARTPSISA